MTGKEWVAGRRTMPEHRRALYHTLPWCSEQTGLLIFFFFFAKDRALSGVFCRRERLRRERGLISGLELRGDLFLDDEAFLFLFSGRG